MAGQLKEVRNRIKSTQSTQQITKAMKMVSAAKLRRAQDAITQMRPYARKLQDMLSNIISSLEGDMNLALAEQRVKESEGCLSYPGLYLKLDRPASIDVEFTDENGAVRQMRLDGVSARCFLHELDHMNGIRMTEQVGPVALQMARRKQEKIIKKIVRHKKK